MNNKPKKMERMWNMKPHLEMHEIIHMAMIGEYHEHLDMCAFCHEQYELAVDLLDYEGFHALPVESNEEETDNGHRQYRLAAQDTESSILDSHVRRTWYLESGNAVLRVMEDAVNNVLYGHLIHDPAKYSTTTIRFSGITQDFHPDAMGTFEIGSASIEVEKMEAFLIEG